MSLPAHAAHYVGAFGELLNFAGAVVLAVDLFHRKREHDESRRLQRLGAWGKKYNLPAKRRGVPVNTDHFAEIVMGRRASSLAYWGVGLLAAGFMLLISYHMIAIFRGE